MSSGSGNSTKTGASETADPFANPLGAFGASWTASANMWSAWADTWRALLEQRGMPATGQILSALANPIAWPESVSLLLDEFRDALALPRFADLPGLSGSALPLAGPFVDLMLAFQQYLAAVMPVWVKACESFQAEVLARRGRGEIIDSAAEGMDLWNNVLDRTLMEFNRSGDFAKIQKRLLRAVMRQRQEVRHGVEGAAQMIDMPTRTEMTDVYKRLHDLTREVHGLRRELRALKAQVPGAGRKTGERKADANGSGAESSSEPA